MRTISSNIKQAFVQSFRHNCIISVCQAHDALCVCHAITQDMDEETISTCLYDYVRNNQYTIEHGIHVNIEHRLLPVGYVQTPTPSKQLCRIDFHFEADCWEQDSVERSEFFMEAKNLYEHNSRKSSNGSIISATFYYKRYINTGIDHIIKGDYPLNAIILGYVLVGDIIPVVDGINTELSSMNRSGEHLFHIPTPYECNSRETFSSNFSAGRIDHLMLKFT